MLTVISTSGAIPPNSIHSSKFCCGCLTQCLCQNLLSRVGSTLTTISLMVYWLIGHSVLINQVHQFSRSGIALYQHQLVNAMGKRLSSCLKIISKFSLQKLCMPRVKCKFQLTTSTMQELTCLPRLLDDDHSLELPHQL